jgi:hypothetical protein
VDDGRVVEWQPETFSCQVGPVQQEHEFMGVSWLPMIALNDVAADRLCNPHAEPARRLRGEM